jgi:hypothetical protein
MDTITLTPELVKLRDDCRRLLNAVLPELREAENRALGEAVALLGKRFDINYDQSALVMAARAEAYDGIDRSESFQGTDRASYVAARTYYEACYRVRACETEILHVTETLRLGLYLLAMDGSIPEGILIG